MTWTCFKKSSKSMPPDFMRASIASASSFDKPESSSPIPGIFRPPRPFCKKSICMCTAVRATARPLGTAGAASGTGWNESD